MTAHKLRSKFAAAALAAVALAPHSLCAISSQQAQAAFLKLQSLEGEWQGADQQGEPVRSYFSPIASHTAVMESVTRGRDEMVSLYSMGLNSILLMHYCASNDQPRLRAVPSSGPIQQLVFSFEQAENPANAAAGHEHRLVIEFEDSDHIIERWTWRSGGKDFDTVFHLARLHLSRN